MTTPVGPPNNTQLTRVLSGAETARGTAANRTNKLYGRMMLRRAQELTDSEDYTGDFFGDAEPVRGAVVVDGNYSQNLTYEDLSFLPRYAIKGGITPVGDSENTEAFTYTYRHSGTRDDIDTATVEYGAPPMPKLCTGLILPEMTISSDIDDSQAVWKLAARAIAIDMDLRDGLTGVTGTGGSTTTFSKTGWGQTIDALIGGWVHIKTATQAGIVGLWREILDNDATSITFAALPATVTSGDVVDVYLPFTSGIADRERERINGPGTKLYLANQGDTIDSADEVTGRFISFSVTEQINANWKRFMDNVDTHSNRLDRGAIRVTGQVRLEFDRRSEWDDWKAAAPKYIRIKQTGDTIDSGAGTTSSAQIDIYNAAWSTPTEDQRGSNVTVTWPFRGYKDLTEGVPIELEVVHAGGTLLA